MGRPKLTPRQFAELREREDYRVMERLRRRIDTLVKDEETAKALKPYYRFMCKRPCSSENYYETFNRPNVKLIDVASTRGVERMTEKGFVATASNIPSIASSSRAASRSRASSGIAGASTWSRDATACHSSTTGAMATRRFMA